MILTDTFYNTAGQVKTTYGSYYNIASPGTTLLTPVDPTKVDSQTATVYDGAGRVVASIFQPGGLESGRTTTAYGGDRVDVTPPAGGTATSTVTDARGRTVELRQYQAATPTGATTRPPTRSPQRTAQLGKRPGGQSVELRLRPARPPDHRHRPRLGHHHLGQRRWQRARLDHGRARPDPGLRLRPAQPDERVPEPHT